MKSLFRLLPLCLVPLLLHSACDADKEGEGESRKAEVVFTDDLGHRILLTDTPRRVMALASSLTEMLAAVADSSQIVAVTQTDDYPAWVKGKLS